MREDILRTGGGPTLRQTPPQAARVGAVRIAARFAQAGAGVDMKKAERAGRGAFHGVITFMSVDDKALISFVTTYDERGLLTQWTTSTHP